MRDSVLPRMDDIGSVSFVPRAAQQGVVEASKVEMEYVRKSVAGAVAVCSMMERGVPLHLQPRTITTEVYQQCYSAVFTTLTRKIPGRATANPTEHVMYEWVKELLRAAAQVLCTKGAYDRCVCFVVHVFRYLDRFYVRRMCLPELSEVAEMQWSNTRLKRAFDRLYFRCYRKAYAPGGRGSKRDLQVLEAVGAEVVPKGGHV